MHASGARGQRHRLLCGALFLLLIIQGGADEQIPVVTTQLLKEHEWPIGEDVERVYPVRSHSGVIPVSMSDMIHCIADRFAGVSNPDPYQPVGQAGIEVSSCAD